MDDDMSQKRANMITIEQLSEDQKLTVLPGYSKKEIMKGKPSKAPAVRWKQYLGQTFNKDKYKYLKAWEAFKGENRSTLLITGKLLDPQRLYLRVIDLDVPKDEGHIDLYKLISLFWDIITKTHTRITPSGGIHIYIIDESKSQETEASLGISTMNIDYQKENQIVNYGFTYQKGEDGIWEKKEYKTHPASTEKVAFISELGYESVDELLQERIKKLFQTENIKLYPKSDQRRVDPIFLGEDNDPKIVQKAGNPHCAVMKKEQLGIEFQNDPIDSQEVTDDQIRNNHPITEGRINNQIVSNHVITKQLTNEEIENVINLLSQYVAEGSRQKYALYISGLLIKQEIDKKTIIRIMKGIFKEDVSQRLGTIENTLQKDPSNIKGWVGIQEIIFSKVKDMKETYIELEKLSKYLHMDKYEERCQQMQKYCQFDEDGIYCTVGTYKEVCASIDQKQIQHITINQIKQMEIRNREVVIDTFPESITIYNSFLEGDQPKYKIIFNDKGGKEYVTGPDLLMDIIDDINASVYSLDPKLTKKVISALILEYERSGKASIKSEVHYPGFFLNERKNIIMPVSYENKEPSEKELKEGLEVISRLYHYFRGEEDKLATCLKWGLISPFSYVKKQLGSWMSWLYLYGAGGTGKTTLGKILIYFYGIPDENTNLSGSGFDTVYRVGDRLSQSTFPIIVNEPKGAFDRDEVVEMVKGSIERTVGRGKYMGRRYSKIPALCSVILTSNHYIPTDEALLRRLYVINFTHIDRKKEEDKENFEKEFNIDNPKHTPLEKLRSIGHFFFNELSKNPGMLNEDWKEVADSLLVRLYADLELEIPTWLLQWARTETMDDMDMSQRELIRNFILEVMNRANQSAKWEDSSGDWVNRETTLFALDENEYKNKMFKILEARLIPSLILQRIKGRDSVLVTTSFLRNLRKRTDINLSMKGLVDLLGGKWKYSKKRTSMGNIRVAEVSFNGFFEFLKLI